MPEKVANQELKEKAIQTEVLPETPALPKIRPVELEFDEADALFGKRTSV